MSNKLNLSKVMVFDIETVCLHKSYNDLSEELKVLWGIKAKTIEKKSSTEPMEETYFNNAGLYPEFSKICCISMGVFEKVSDESYKIRLKSFASEDESQILQGFADLMNGRKSWEHILVGHNIKMFDVPFVCKRLSILGILIPEYLNTFGKKSWDMTHILDTKEIWKHGGYDSASLRLLCAVFGIPSPKEGIDGSDVSRVFYEGGLDLIKLYCERDVVATSKVLMKLLQMDIEISLD
jgi:DNA polymerase III epsilon subunit-like protein